MLVEFSELLDRTELSPVATNMTVEAMPNDNLVRNTISINTYRVFNNKKMSRRVMAHLEALNSLK